MDIHEAWYQAIASTGVRLRPSADFIPGSLVVEWCSVACTGCGVQLPCLSREAVVLISILMRVSVVLDYCSFYGIGGQITDCLMPDGFRLTLSQDGPRGCQGSSFVGLRLTLSRDGPRK